MLTSNRLKREQLYFGDEIYTNFYLANKQSDYCSQATVTPEVFNIR